MADRLTEIEERYHGTRIEWSTITDEDAAWLINEVKLLREQLAEWRRIAGRLANTKKTERRTKERHDDSTRP